MYTRAFIGSGFVFLKGSALLDWEGLGGVFVLGFERHGLQMVWYNSNIPPLAQYLASSLFIARLRLLNVLFAVSPSHFQAKGPGTALALLCSSPY